MPTDTSFWRGRPTLVTDATGLVGSWVVRRLLELEADVVCLLGDWVPESELLQAELIGKTSIVQG
jgi:CDP-glucose 4,6-dehydratase